ncbi:MAG: hypothetical protein L0211_13625 [Planctomycetaceae bacterium]|nr:hypothetical protein [Planctomycetaceae bacterium]
MTCTESTINWETEVAALLDELTSVEQELLALLARKHEQLAIRDWHARADIRAGERRLAARLAHCQVWRADLLAAKVKEVPGESTINRPGGSARRESGGTSGRSRSRNKRFSAMQILRSDNIPEWVQAQRALLQVAQLVEAVANLSPEGR